MEFFILEDLKPLLSRLYTILNSMGGSSSKEPEKTTEVGPPTKQMKDSPTINTQGGLHLFSMTGSPAGALLVGSLFVLSLLVGFKIYKNYKKKTREARVRKRINKQKEVIVEMGWPTATQHQSPTPQAPATQTSAPTGRPSGEVLKEWQTVILPMLQHHQSVPDLEPMPGNISPPTLFLDHGRYANFGHSSNFGHQVAAAPHAPRYYHGHHRSWSPSRFTEEAEIHLPRRPAPTREQAPPSSSQQAQQPVAQVKPHLPRLQEPEKDF